MKLKKIILLSFSLLVCLVSCKPKTDKNAVGSRANEPTQKNTVKNTSESVQQPDTANVIVPITQLPFGPKLIVKYKFPDAGWADPMDGPVSKIDKKYQRKVCFTLHPFVSDFISKIVISELFFNLVF